MGCPYCGCDRFYFKDPVDEYEVYAFHLKGTDLVFDSDVHASSVDVGEENKIYCENCAWHGKVKDLR